MSRSAVGMVVAGAILLGVFAVIGLHYWPSLSVKGWVVKAIVLGLGVYGALLSAVMIRRIGDPSLPMPILAWIIAGVWFLFSAMATANRRQKDVEFFGFDPRENKPQRSSSFGKQGTGRAWAILLTLVGLAMYGGGIALAWDTSRIVEAPIAPKPKVAEESASDSRTATPMLPPDIVDQKDVRAAIAIALPKLTDTRDAPSEGAKLLLRWAAARMKWADVAVAKNETSLELVEKDPGTQIGKRLCVAGRLAKIEKQTVDGIELHVARIALANGDAIEMYAVGKTGTLVKRKQAKFCGVVTGRYDGGGPPATFAVGMFDTAK
jgi:hypothetical protein